MEEIKERKKMEEIKVLRKKSVQFFPYMKSFILQGHSPNEDKGKQDSIDGIENK